MEPPHTRGVEVYALGVKLKLGCGIKNIHFSRVGEIGAFSGSRFARLGSGGVVFGSVCLSVCVFLSLLVCALLRSLSAYRSLSCTMTSTEVERREGRGRCLIAAKDFGLGDLVSAPYTLLASQPPCRQ